MCKQTIEHIDQPKDWKLVTVVTLQNNGKPIWTASPITVFLPLPMGAKFEAPTFWLRRWWAPWTFRKLSADTRPTQKFKDGSMMGVSSVLVGVGPIWRKRAVQVR